MAEYTSIECPSSDSAHALHAYLLVEIGNEDAPADISAQVQGSTLRVTHNYDNDRARREWDWQLIGYRDGRASLEDLLKEAYDALSTLDLEDRESLLRRIEAALAIRKTAAR